MGVRDELWGNGQVFHSAAEERGWRNGTVKGPLKVRQRLLMESREPLRRGREEVGIINSVSASTAVLVVLLARLQIRSLICLCQNMTGLSEHQPGEDFYLP